MTNGIGHHGEGASTVKHPVEAKPEAKAVAAAKPIDPKTKGGEKSK